MVCEREEVACVCSVDGSVLVWSRDSVVVAVSGPMTDPSRLRLFLCGSRKKALWSWIEEVACFSRSSRVSVDSVPCG